MAAVAGGVFVGAASSFSSLLFRLDCSNSSSLLFVALVEAFGQQQVVVVVYWWSSQISYQNFRFGKPWLGEIRSGVARDLFALFKARGKTRAEVLNRMLLFGVLRNVPL